MKKPVLSCPIAVIPTLDSKKSMVYHDGRQTPFEGGLLWASTLAPMDSAGKPILI